MDRRSRFSPDPLPRDLHSLRTRAASQPPRSAAVHSDAISFALPVDSLSRSSLHRSAQSPVRDRPSPWGQRLSRSPVVNRIPPIRSASFSAGNVPEDELWQAGTSIQATFDEDDEESLLDNWPNGEGGNGAEPRSWGGGALHDTHSRYRNTTHAAGPRSRSLVANFTNAVPMSSHSLGAGLNRVSDWDDRSATFHESFDNRFLHEFSPRANGTRSQSLQSTASIPIALAGHRSMATEISNMSPFVRDRLGEEPRYHDHWSSLASMREEEMGGASGTTSRRHSVSIVPQPRARGVGFATPIGVEDGNIGQRYGVGRAGFSDEELAEDFGMMNLNGGLPHGTLDHLQQAPAFPYSVPTRMQAQSPPRSRLSVYHAALEQSQVVLDMQSRERHRSPSLGRPGAAETRFPASGYNGMTQALNGNGISALDDPERCRREDRSLSPYRNIDSRGHSPGGPLSPSIPQQAPDSARFDQQQFSHFSSDQGHGQGQSSGGGQGIALDDIPANTKLVAVEFKLGRKELFYIDAGVDVKTGDRLIVEGDRGKDIGTAIQVNVDKTAWLAGQTQQGLNAARKGTGEVAVPVNPHQKAKRAYGVAGPQETQCVISISKFNQNESSYFRLYRDWAKKEEDEQKALQLCQSKVRQKKLPMQVVDCEFQWFVSCNFDHHM
jgi:PSP1 C-terminal conserved region